MKKMFLFVSIFVLLFACTKSTKSVEAQSNKRYSEIIKQNPPVPEDFYLEMPITNPLRSLFEVAFMRSSQLEDHQEAAESAIHKIVNDIVPEELDEKDFNWLYPGVYDWLLFDNRLSTFLIGRRGNEYYDYGEYVEILHEFRSALASDASTWGTYAIPNNLNGLQRLRTTPLNLQINAAMLFSVHIQTGWKTDNLPILVRKYLYLYCMLAEANPNFIGTHKLPMSVCLSYMNNNSLTYKTFFNYTDAKDTQTFSVMWITWRRGRIIYEIFNPWWDTDLTIRFLTEENGY